MDINKVGACDVFIHSTLRLCKAARAGGEANSQGCGDEAATCRNFLSARWKTVELPNGNTTLHQKQDAFKAHQLISKVNMRNLKKFKFVANSACYWTGDGGGGGVDGGGGGGLFSMKNTEKVTR
jgi:hypothetical protein